MVDTLLVNCRTKHLENDKNIECLQSQLKGQQEESPERYIRCQEESNNSSANNVINKEKSKPKDSDIIQENKCLVNANIFNEFNVNTPCDHMRCVLFSS